MQMHRFLAGVLLIALATTAAPARAVDYDKIDRSIVKEPKYKSDSPRYALLLFGPEAKLRVWMVIDEKNVYLDRNADGDLTGKDERFEEISDCKNIEIANAEQRSSYTIEKISVYHQPEAQEPHPRSSADVAVKINGPVKYRQYSDTWLFDTPQKAAVSHFHDPLTIGPRTINWKIAPRLALRAGEEAGRLGSVIGTMDEKHQCWVVVCCDAGGPKSPAFPNQFPTAQVEFPSKLPGGDVIQKLYVLDQFCCGAIFYGDVQVPTEAGLGKAKVTFAFDAWPEGKVAPSTVEIPVVSPEQAKDVGEKAAEK